MGGGHSRGNVLPGKNSHKFRSKKKNVDAHGCNDETDALEDKLGVVGGGQPGKRLVSESPVKKNPNRAKNPPRKNSVLVNSEL
jgi:hypothetical protein